MTESKDTSPIVVSVLAASGQQSSSVVAHLLSLGSEFSQDFRLRAIVRDPSKYVSPGNAPDEVIAGDMSSAESLDKAFHETDVLFAMTTANPSEGEGVEIAQGKAIIDAFVRCCKNRASSPRKPLLLFSSFVDVEAATGGEIKMANGTSKSKIESYLHALPRDQQDAFSVTFVHPGMFMQNFLNYQKPTVDDAGVYHFTGPVRRDVQIPFVDIADLGPLVWHLIKTAYLTDQGARGYEEYDRATVRLYGQYLSYPQLIAHFEKATGKPAAYDQMNMVQFLSEIFGTPESNVKAQLESANNADGQETMITMIDDMYNLINRYGYYGDDAPGMDEYRKDVRMQKVVQQQPTRRTTWAAFARKAFGSPAGHETVLTLPANFPGASSLTRAESFLYEHISYFVRACQAGPDAQLDFEKVALPKFHPEAVIEFPYFPKPFRDTLGLRPLSDAASDGAMLLGHGEILGYFKDWRSIFEFEKGELQSLSALSSSTSQRVATAKGAMIEARLTGVVKQGGQTKPYVQDYSCFAFLDEDGMVIRYREYWDPSRL